MAETKNKAGQDGGGSDTSSLLSGLNGTQKLVLILSLVLIVTGAVVALTLVLAYRYASPEGTTSVLGVIVPVFLTVIGIVAGGTAGVATGAAGRQATAKSLASAQASLQVKNEAADALAPKVRQLVAAFRPTPQAQHVRFTGEVAGRSAEDVPPSEHLDDILFNLGKLEG